MTDENIVRQGTGGPHCFCDESAGPCAICCLKVNPSEEELFSVGDDSE